MEVLFSFEGANPTDFFHLGDDGVLRHFNESGTVLNYAQLSPPQISQALADTSSINTAEEKDHISSVFENLDVHDVQGSALLNPLAYIYPTGFLSNCNLSEWSEVLLPDLGLSARQHCVSRRCYPSNNCGRYSGCTRCFVRDSVHEGTCE